MDIIADRIEVGQVMFFIMGIDSGRKDFDFSQTVICAICGKYGRYQVYMTYTVLSLFFIPCFKWNRHYYVQTSCCGSVYELDPAVGRRIAAGEDIEITPEDMTVVYNGGNGCNSGYYGGDHDRGYSGSGSGNNGGFGSNSGSGSGRRHCGNCGYTTDEDYDYCPKCGKPLEYK